MNNEFRTNVHRLQSAGRERVCTGMEYDDDFYDDASAQEAPDEGACLRVRRLDARLNTAHSSSPSVAHNLPFAVEMNSPPPSPPQPKRQPIAKLVESFDPLAGSSVRV